MVQVSLRCGAIAACPAAVTEALYDDLSASAPPRYTSIPLPSYRFVPGLRPHPLVDSRGHSYRRGSRFPVVAVDRDRWQESQGYLYGCDLYNRGYWWEAHEAWESVWHLARRHGPERTALQGLIQLANCHLKLYMGRVNAVRRLRESYGAHLERAAGLAGSRILGLHVTRFRSRADAYVLDVTGRDTPEHDPTSYPYLELHDE